MTNDVINGVLTYYSNYPILIDNPKTMGSKNNHHNKFAFLKLSVDITSRTATYILSVRILSQSLSSGYVLLASTIDVELELVAQVTWTWRLRVFAGSCW
jgi:hypothetical protein